MITIANPEEVRTYMLRKGWLDPAARVRITPLTGGVSGQVWKIESSDGRRMVMKQALARLNVNAEWYSDVSRIVHEQRAMRFLADKLSGGTIPAVLHSDEENYVFMMTCAPDEAVPWKGQLLSGDFDPIVSEAAGSLLGQLHRTTAAEHEWAAVEELTYFRQLRIEPFYDYLRDHVYPEHAAQFDRLSHRLMHDRTTFVHGDYSPKNMLVDADKRLILLDFEVAHRGNPVFDLAFCLAHLTLKGWVSGRSEEACELIRAFMRGYGAPTWPDLPAHLGVMLLARIDGKSPVEYVKSAELKADVRKGGLRLLFEPQEEHIVNHIRRLLGGADR